jgi:hypothetical protein
MGLLDWLFGRKEERRAQPAVPTYGLGDGEQQLSDVDGQALQRYRYMLRTAPPETIEQAHEEAFAKLTPAQRERVLRELAALTPEGEQAALAGRHDDPKTLARMATRAEMREPGAVERTLGGRGMGTGMGGMMAGTIFGSLVAGFVGSMVADQFFESVGDVGSGDEQIDDSAGDDYSDGGGDSGNDSGSDWGGGDWGDMGGGDFGGDF